MPKWIVFIFLPDMKHGTPGPLHYELIDDFQKLIDTVILHTKNKDKFSVYEIGKCIGDYS